jgi:2-polyprenyl-3-methyl-5-hydroxy-6-metoxy-1,4-benzoquinol methylase
VRVSGVNIMQLFHQTNVPVNQNLLYKSAEDAKKALTGELDIHYNEDTGFIYNNAFNVDLVNYSEEYNNDQHYSPFFESYVDEQIEWCIKKYLHQTSTIIEIGCGKGYFIKKIAERLPSSKAYGFDTSYIQGIEEDPTNLHIFKEYYNENYAYLQPNAVICRHVIEHIHKPTDFLSTIRASMPENALLFLETPDVNWILENDVIFDFFYEHCSYFNMFSLENMLRMSGFEPIESIHTFNGQYMWVVSRAVNKNVIEKQSKNENISALCQKFTNNRKEKINKISATMQALAQKENAIFIWGAGAKGVTFVNLFDQQQKYISALIDINPAKQDRYVGVTSHEVISPDKMRIKYNTSQIIILNNNYFKEIEMHLMNLGIYNRTQLYTIT